MGTELANLANTIERAFCALASVTTHYNRFDYEDGDDFIETMMTIESLVANGGVNHRDLVARFRAGRRTEINGRIVTFGNRDATSQMGKLRASKDPFYLATDGQTNGAAMRAMAPAFFFTSFDEMVYATAFISRITHAHPDAQMAAVMMALAYRLAFLERGDWSLSDLVVDVSRAMVLLGPAYERSGLYIVKKLELFPTSANEIKSDIGFCHSANSSPLAAVIVGRDVQRCYEFLDHGFPPEPHKIWLGSDRYLDELDDNDSALNHLGTEDRAASTTYDADTFYSMAMPLMAMRERGPRKHGIFESFKELSQELAKRWA